MKTPHKFALFIFALAASLCGAGVKLNIDFPSNYQEGPPTQTAPDVRLSEIELVGDVGTYIPRGNYTTYAAFEYEDCCLSGEKVPTGKTAVFKVENRTVNWTFQPEISLPAWQGRSKHVSNCPAGYTTNCPSVAEWDRFVDAIRDHEILHHLHARNFFLGDLSSYFAEQKEQSTPCRSSFSSEEANAMRVAIRNALMAMPFGK